jgi:hypothetical protein
MIFPFIGCEKEPPYDYYADKYVIKVTGLPGNARSIRYTYLNIYRVGDNSRTSSVARSNADEYEESSITYILYTAIAGGILGGSVTYEGDGGPFIIELEYSDDLANRNIVYIKNKTLNMGVTNIPYSDFGPW